MPTTDEKYRTGNFELAIEEGKLKGFQLNPNVYPKAGWRGVSSITSDGRIGLSFDLENGEVVRLQIDKKSANQLQGAINDLFYWASLSQSERLSEMDNSDGEMPEELDQTEP